MMNYLGLSVVVAICGMAQILWLAYARRKGNLVKQQTAVAIVQLVLGLGVLGVFGWYMLGVEPHYYSFADKVIAANGGTQVVFRTPSWEGMVWLWRAMIAAAGGMLIISGVSLYMRGLRRVPVFAQPDSQVPT